MGRRLVAHLQLSGCATERTMLLLLPLLPLLHSSFAATTAPLETYTETREVTDNGGNVFSCSYSLSYDPNTAKVYRQESSVTCEPNTNGKQTEELLIIEAINKTAYVTYVPRVDKTGIKKIVTSDYVAGVDPTAPTTTSTTPIPLETYTETRDVTDSAGTTFSCTYNLAYDAATAKVYRTRSSVSCDPNTTGQETVEEITIEAINKTATVTYVPRTDLTGIKKIALSDYIPTTTVSPATTTEAGTTAAATTGEATTAAATTASGTTAAGTTAAGTTAAGTTAAATTGEATTAAATTAAGTTAAATTGETTTVAATAAAGTTAAGATASATTGEATGAVTTGGSTTAAATTVSSCAIDQKLADALELIQAAKEEASQSCSC